MAEVRAWNQHGVKVYLDGQILPHGTVDVVSDDVIYVKAGDTTAVFARFQLSLDDDCDLRYDFETRDRVIVLIVAA